MPEYTGDFDPLDPKTNEIKAQIEKDALALGNAEVAAAVSDLQQAYKAVFGDLTNPNVKLVLEDLALFTRAHSSAFAEDPRRHAALEGRREVYYRIADHTQLPRDLLYERYVAAMQQRK